MRKTFTLLEREELSSNPNIKKVFNSNIEFFDKFKQFAVDEQVQKGKSSKQIFKEAGIPDWLNIKDYAKDNLKRWKRQLLRVDKLKRGRTPKALKPNSEMSFEELQARIFYLEAEVEFLKKLEALEQQTLMNALK